MPTLSQIMQLGIVGIALLVILALLFIAIKFILPLAIASRPPNGKPDSAGPLYLVLQQIGTLPGEVKALNATISALMNNIWTKAEMMEEFHKNRHDIANAMSAPIMQVAVELKRGLIEIRKIEERRLRSDRRGKTRSTSDRRGK